MSVNHSARSESLIWISFRFSLTRGDSNEYTQYTIFNIERKTIQNYPKSAAMGYFQRDLSTCSK